jgi:hypothetical protein
MDDLLTAIGYEAWLYDRGRAARAQTRWGNVQELATG